MLKKIVLVIVALIVVFLGRVALQNPNYEISRQVSIHAKPEKIFPYLNSAKLAEEWQRWNDVDPGVKMQYDGPESGVGSRASWSGGKNLGTGSATITESVPNQRVAIQLAYSEPMAMTQFAEYTAEPAGENTVVTWKVRGENTFVGRLMCTFFNMDKMVGGMFEKGLARLKEITEK